MQPFQTETISRNSFIRLLAGASGCSVALSVSARPGFNSQVSFDHIVNIRLGNKTVPGFIAMVDGKCYIITCTTLILGQNRVVCETLGGEQLKPLKIELSVNRNIVRFLIDSSDGLEPDSSVTEGEPVNAVKYSRIHGGFDFQPAEASDVEDDHFFIDTPDEKKPYGSPVLNEAGRVCGIASAHDHYKMRDDVWEPRTIQTVYPLEGDQWISPNWKKYNVKFGQVLSDADAFRHDIYALAREWLENPSEKLELEEITNIDVQQWVKQHNSMVNRCYNARRNAANKEDPYHGIRNNFRDNCRELGRIVKKKADTLKFLAENKQTTPFMNKELMWRFFEMYVFAEYVWRQRKKASSIQ